MVNKCVAPNCRTGYDKTSKEKGSGDGSKRNFTDHPLHVYHFPKEKELFERWKHAVPRKDWEPSKNSVLCEKHFLPTDFKELSTDTNASRKTKKGNTLDRHALKADAIPSQWPDCPITLSKSPPLKRTTLNKSSTAREQNQLLQDKRIADRGRENDTFNSLDELAMKMDMECLSLDIVTSRSKSNVMFLAICHEEKPNINYCLKLDEFLH